MRELPELLPLELPPEPVAVELLPLPPAVAVVVPVVMEVAAMTLDKEQESRLSSHSSARLFAVGSDAYDRVIVLRQGL